MSEQDNLQGDDRREVLVGAHVSQELRDRLRARAVREDRSVSSLIRRALDRELDEHEEPA